MYLKHFLKSSGHLSLASHQRDVANSLDPVYGVRSGFTLFAIRTGISVNHGNNKNLPDIPFTGNGPVQRVKVE